MPDLKKKQKNEIRSQSLSREVVFLPEDFSGEEGVDRKVTREDLVVVNEVFGGLLKLSSSCDVMRQPGKRGEDRNDEEEITYVFFSSAPISVST